MSVINSINNNFSSPIAQAQPDATPIQAALQQLQAGCQTLHNNGIDLGTVFNMLILFYKTIMPLYNSGAGFPSNVSHFNEAFSNLEKAMKSMNQDSTNSPSGPDPTFNLPNDVTYALQSCNDALNCY